MPSTFAITDLQWGTKALPMCPSHIFLLHFFCNKFITPRSVQLGHSIDILVEENILLHKGTVLITARNRERFSGIIIYHVIVQKFQQLVCVRQHRGRYTIIKRMSRLFLSCARQRYEEITVLWGVSMQGLLCIDDEVV